MYSGQSMRGLKGLGRSTLQVTLRAQHIYFEADLPMLYVDKDNVEQRPEWNRRPTAQAYSFPNGKL